MLKINIYKIHYANANTNFIVVIYTCMAGYTYYKIFKTSWLYKSEGQLIMYIEMLYTGTVM